MRADSLLWFALFIGIVIFWRAHTDEIKQEVRLSCLRYRRLVRDIKIARNRITARVRRLLKEGGSEDVDSDVR